MSDPFDNISIHKSTDKPLHHKKKDDDETNSARDFIAQYLGENEQTRDKWCIARFVSSPGKTEKATHGWILTKLKANNDANISVKMFYIKMGGLGWSETGQVACFNEADAKETVKALKGTSKISFDVAIPIEKVLWRVLFTSSFDYSKVEMYRGLNYNLAEDALAKALLVVSRLDGFYGKAKIEGVISLADAEQYL